MFATKRGARGVVWTLALTGASTALAGGPTPVSGTISSDQVWTPANSPYQLTSTVTINNGATLTIEPGVVVMGDSNATLRVSEGAISAIGTPALPILMTSTLDSGPDQWDGVIVAGANSTAEFQHCEFRYAGQTTAFGFGAAIVISTSPMVTIDQCIVRDCSGSPASNSGIAVGGSTAAITNTQIIRCGDQPTDRAIDEFSASPAFSISNCTFEDNAGYAARVHAGSIGNVSNNTFIANNTNRIQVAPGSTTDGAVVTKQSSGFEGFELLNGNFLISSGSTLTITEGVHLFGETSNSEIAVQGRLESLGTALEPVVMTSLDDTSATLWDGISLNGANASGLLQWTQVRRGGGINVFGVRSNITAGNSQLLRLENCTISDIDVPNIDYGIYNSNGIIECVQTTFRNCGGENTDFAYGTATSAGTTVLENCVFENNIGQCAQIQPGSTQGATGCTFSGNSIPRIRIFPGATAPAGAMQDMVGLDSWEIGNGDLLVPAGSVMTIGPGAVIKGLNANSELAVQGRLESLGTPANPIVMTSFDDTNATNWDGVSFNGANASGLMQWTTVRRGGAGNVFGVRSNISAVNAQDIILENCAISDIQANGIEYGIYASNANAICSDTTFARCGDALEDFGFYAVTPGNAHALIDCTYQDNLGVPARVTANSLSEVFGGAFVGANTLPRIRIMASNMTADQQMVPINGMEGWEIGNGDVLVTPGTTLTILPGTTIFGMGDNSELALQGRLNALGTELNPITMTSSDDTAATTWDGVSLNGANASGLLQWTNIRRAAGGNVFGLNANLTAVNTPDLVIQNCELSDSVPTNLGQPSYGLYISNSTTTVSDSFFSGNGSDSTESAGVRTVSGTVRIEDCSIVDNIQNGLYVSNGTTSLSCSYFRDNLLNGIRRIGNTVLNASECSFEGTLGLAVLNESTTNQLNICCSWWGDMTGPAAPMGSGTGVAISANVGFNPFSATPEACGFECLQGDANNDGAINLADLNLILANFGNAVEKGRDGDVTDDGAVDLADLNLVLANFGRACLATS